jgi:hypothetical protein
MQLILRASHTRFAILISESRVSFWVNFFPSIRPKRQLYTPIGVSKHQLYPSNTPRMSTLYPFWGCQNVNFTLHHALKSTLYPPPRGGSPDPDSNTNKRGSGGQNQLFGVFFHLFFIFWPKMIDFLVGFCVFGVSNTNKRGSGGRFAVFSPKRDVLVGNRKS